MSVKNLNLVLAVFDDQGTAEQVSTRLPKLNRNIVSVVIMEKDSQEQVSIKDIGRTPTRGTVNGAVLGGVVTILTGGTGLALSALGGAIGFHETRKKQADQVMPDRLHDVAGSLGLDSSAIIAVLRGAPKEVSLNIVKEAGGELFEAIIPHDPTTELNQQADEAYDALLSGLADKTGGELHTTVPYPKIHVVVNPVSGKDQPIINVLNHVFYQYGIEWDISITKKYGDAEQFARNAAKAGFDLVAGYGGDGTQHEVANGLMGTGVTMGVLPGDTGNGFGTELDIPNKLESAVELLCSSYNRRKIDIVKLEDWPEEYFVQRLFTGIEPEEQTSREEKNKYGTLAYLQRDIKRISELEDSELTLIIDDEVIEVLGYKCYVVNSARAGTGLATSEKFKVDDGLLDVFVLAKDWKSSNAALDRFFGLQNKGAGMYYWRGQKITINADQDQPVWTDGEYTGRTPVTMAVVPGGLTVAVG